MLMYMVDWYFILFLEYFSYMVLELMETDLYKVMQTMILHDELVQKIAYQVLKALKYTHSARIIHRDLVTWTF